MKPKKLLSFILAAAMAISILPTFTLTASATETQTTTEKNITLGTLALSGYDSINKYKYVYYGTYESNPIKWRILTMNGNEGTYYESAEYAPTQAPTTPADGTVYTDSDETTKFIYLENSGKYYKKSTATPMFLLSEYALKQMAYEAAYNTDDGDGQTNPSDWRYSDAWNWCNNTSDNTSFISSSFTDSEKEYFLKTSKNNSLDNEYTDELNGDTFFLLSYDEACENYIKNDRIAKLSNESGDAAVWWLRSHEYDNYVYCVWVNGFFNQINVDYTIPAVRPAFNLNLSSVLFTSAADGKKVTNVGTLSTNAENSGKEYKLTMLDASRNFALTDTSAKTVKTGGEISLGYSGAKIGTNEYISAMLVKDGKVLYYGQLANATSASDEVYFNIPTDIDGGEYELRLFNEQINGDYKTDFSSDFKTVTLNVLPKTVFTTEPTAKTLTYSGAPQDLVTAGETSEGTVKYSLLENGSYSADIPTGKDADDYKVWYYIEGDSTHSDSDKKSVEVAIGKSTPTENPEKKTTARVKRGRTLAEATVTEGEILGLNDTGIEGTFAWVDDTTETINADCTKQMTFTPTDTNYAPITVGVAVSTYSSGSGGGSTSRYTVKFNTNGGNTITSQTVKKNATATEPTNPTKEGYIFDGWYTDSKLTTEYDFDTKVTKNITLYAKWVEDEVQEPNDDKKDDNKDNEQKPTTDEWKNPFTDVTSADWFFDNVKYANKNGLMSGVTNTEFAPNESLTRAMLVTVLYRLEGEPAVNKNVPFADVKADMYYANAVIWAEQNGIVNGVTETEFAPDENITREQIAVILYRYAKYKDYDVSVGEDTNILSYADFDEISEYAISAVQYAVGSGLIKGKTETTLNPKDNATRAEIAAILNRFVEGNK